MAMQVLFRRQKEKLELEQVTQGRMTEGLEKRPADKSRRIHSGRD